MGKLVESLKRLYPDSVSIEKLTSMVEKNSISPEEFKEITGTDFVSTSGGEQ